MGKLIFAYRNAICFIKQDIRGLQNRIAQETVGGKVTAIGLS